MSKTGIIYKIVSVADVSKTPLYIGSTIRTLHKRFLDHKANKKDRRHYPIYTHIHAHGGWNNFTLCEIETIQFNDIVELRRCEQKHINTLILKEGVLKLNSKSAHLFGTEHEKKEAGKEYQILYKETHKARIKEQRKIKYKHDKLLKVVLAECIKEICD